MAGLLAAVLENVPIRATPGLTAFPPFVAVVPLAVGSATGTGDGVGRVVLGLRFCTPAVGPVVSVPVVLTWPERWPFGFAKVVLDAWVASAALDFAWHSSASDRHQAAWRWDWDGRALRIWSAAIGQWH